MTRFIVSLAYKLEAAKKYKKFKEFTYNILENNSYKYKRYFDFFMVFLVISTVAIMIFEVNHKHLAILDIYEFFAIMIFVFEYIGRLWVNSHCHKIIIEDYENANFLKKKYKFSKSLKHIFIKKLDFILSPMAIIDLLAILPYYRPLRILRIFLIFRLFKILRYANSIKGFFQVVKERKFELYTLGFLYVIILFFGSTIIFIYEGPEGVNDNIVDFFDAVYWAVITISTVGFGDIVPITPEGKIVTTILVISAFLLIAFGTSIITTGLSERMEVIKEERVEAEASKMKNFILVCGFDKTSEYFCQELALEDKKFIVLDLDRKKIEYAKSLGFFAIVADATNMNTLENLGINEGASSVIIFTSNDAVNLSIVLSVRALNKDINIVSKVNKNYSLKKFYFAGVNEAISSNELTAFVSSQYIEKPIAFEAFDEILLNKDTDALIDEIDINEYDLITKDISFVDFKKYNITLLGIINSDNIDNFIFNPSVRKYELKQNDILIVMGLKISIIQLKSDLLSDNL